MRTLFAVSLALVLVALPAAQAEACRCSDGGERSASSCGCCCAATDRACSCCPAGEDEQKPGRLDGACPCSQSAPQAPTPVMDDLPAVEALASAPDADAPRLGDAHVPATVEHRAPHPTVSLPLLL